MDQASHNKIVSFIWGIADDVLRDLFVRGKYRDVILPMCVLRRLDAVLERTKKQVLETKTMLDQAGITEQQAALCSASGQAFYNTSKFSLRDLKSRGSQQQLKADFEDYLDGFSQNVQDILTNFEFRNVLARLSKNDGLGGLIERFLDPEINLSPNPVLNGDGSVKYPAMDNHSMGTVFEELVRRFNEENNEEAGEHWTPRDAVRLMTTLMFRPIADRVKAGSYLLYDCACGTGGMLTVAEETLQKLAAEHKQKVVTHLYGQEINPETYAICKADMLLKGEGESADHIIGGAEWSTLSHDAFPAQEFDFMLANPPYGKSWKKDLEAMGGKDGMRDPRFKVMHRGEELSLVTRSSDGQLLFLANMASKMNHKSALGSRIAEVHNGSSLFTGEAGSGESNIRRWLFENDWIEAIIALPLNLFYNTGIATYVWVLSNKKTAKRKGKVQLIDATLWFKPLRKNLGKKNCELSEDGVQRVMAIYDAFAETEQSKIFANEAFGYWKVTVERPLRLHSQLTTKAIESLRFASGDEEIRSALYDELGDALFEDFGSVKAALERRLAEWGTSDDDGDDDEEDDAPKKSLPEKKKKKLLDPKTWERDARLIEVATALHKSLGGGVFHDHNDFRRRASDALDKLGIKLGAADTKLLFRAVSWREDSAPPVIAKAHKPGKASADPLRGRFEATVDGKKIIVEYEPDSDLRDSEQVPLLEEGGIEAFVKREVLPYAPDAWFDESKTQVGYEVSFTRHFYKPQRLRTLDEIAADILATEKEAEGLLQGLVKRGGRVIEDLRPYPNRLSVRVPYLPLLPGHWEVRRVKTLFREVDRRSLNGRERLLSLRMHAGLVDHHASGGKPIPPSALIGYKRILPGELVMNRMRAALGLFGAASSDGLVSPDYAVFQVAPDVLLSYAVHLFRTPMMASVFRMESRGLGTGEAGFLRLYTDRFGVLLMPLPPMDEQAAIVRFLDHANRRIDRFIQVKKQLIALLNEQKEAIIHRSVTRGLDPKVSTKGSGVPWLGEIPAHWEVQRLKQCITRVEQGWSPQCEAQPGTPNEWCVLKVGCVNRDAFSPEQNKRLPSTLSPKPELEIRHDDILVSRANTPQLLGLAALAESPRQRLLLCDKLFRFRALAQYSPRFLVHVLRARPIRAQIESSTNGASSSMQNIGQAVLKDLVLAAPRFRNSFASVKRLPRGPHLCGGPWRKQSGNYRWFANTVLAWSPTSSPASSTCAQRRLRCGTRSPKMSPSPVPMIS